MQGGLILFNTCKKELGQPQGAYSKLWSILSNDKKFKVGVNQDTVSLETLAEAILVILAAPTEMFSQDELDALKSYIQGGGNVLILLNEGGEPKLHTNLNYLLEQYGMFGNSDSVIRTVYSRKYFHPKECNISNGIINREISHFGKNKAKLPKYASNLLKDDGFDDSEDHGGLCFMYPYGCSLNVVKPSIPILSSGALAYPLNRPVAGIYTSKARKGRLMAIGSYELLSDAFIEKEENIKLQHILFKWLLTNEIDLDLGLEEDNDIQDYIVTPDTGLMSEQLKSCLQTSEDQSQNFRNLFDFEMFRFDTTLVPETIQLYSQMTVKHDTLTLIPPQFETPLPNLMPAVFPPNLKEPLGPSLDMYDLDEEFASEKIRLDQLTNKYLDEDVEYYIRECGDILGVTQQIERLKFGYGGENDAKAILHKILLELVKFKKQV
jgi:intraflagellar transport protein 52